MDRTQRQQAQKTAVIIGAGPAGLTAAYRLLKETQIHPIVLEAGKEAGGISRTVCYHGNRMDIGGHRFFSKNQEVMNFWKELMPIQGGDAVDDALLGRAKPLEPGGPDPEREDRVMLVRDRVSRIFYLRRFFDYPISLKPQTFINMGLGRTFRSGFGYIRSALFKREEKTLADFMINRFGRPLYEMFFEDYTRKVWGRDPSELSADWGAQRIRGLSLSKAVLAILKKPFEKRGDIGQKNVETSLIEQFLYPKKGPGQLWETLAAEVVRLGGEIRYGWDVEGVGADTQGRKVRAVSARTPEGLREVETDYVLSSMPVSDLVRGMGDAAPASVRGTALALPYRDFITVGLLVKKLKIRNATKISTVSDIVPDCWIYIQERDVHIGRLQIFNNWSPYMVKDLKNTVWVGLEYFCNEGDELWEMPDGAFIDFAVQELAKIGMVDPADVLDATRIRVKKAYPAYFGAYERFGEVRDFLDTFENLYCIGRNGQHRYNNMDHSMLTAMEAVRSIREGGGKAAVWDVNTEESYQEEK